jgi:protein DJ-1
MAKTVLFILSEGSEEMESTITIDVLRRAGVSILFLI